MPQCAVRGDILWDMERTGLSTGAQIGNHLDESQLVECTPEMAAWCKEEEKRYSPNSAEAHQLRMTANLIENALRPVI